MTSGSLYLTFVLAVSGLMLLPGPNVALIVANSIAHGTRFGLLTVAGTSSAMIIQLVLTSLGMAAVLEKIGGGLEWMRWIGAAYLLYLAVVNWRAPPADLSGTQPQRRSSAVIFARGVFVSLTNPKTLLFYAAFFPQFVVANDAIVAQLFFLSLTFVALAVFFDSAWALLAGRLRGLLASHGRLRNRVSAAFLVIAGAGMALVRRP